VEGSGVRFTHVLAGLESCESKSGCATTLAGNAAVSSAGINKSSEGFIRAPSVLTMRRGQFGCADGERPFDAAHIAVLSLMETF